MIDDFFNLDLSKVDVLMADRYSIFGPEPRLPSDMVRSMLVALKMKIIGYTAWSSELKMNNLAVIISGFDPGDTPGVGTFYDFIDRLWLSDKDNLSPHAKPPKMKKVQKPKNPDDKADPIEDITVDQLIEQVKASPPIDDQPYARLFQLFKEVFLDHSVELGLIDLDHFVISGDGTEVETSARPRYRRLCNCLETAGAICIFFDKSEVFRLIRLKNHSLLRCFRIIFTFQGSFGSDPRFIVKIRSFSSRIPKVYKNKKIFQKGETFLRFNASG